MTDPKLEQSTDKIQFADALNGMLIAKPNNPKRYLNSIGTKLFLSVMGGALIGLGGMSLCFYNIFLEQSKTQIQGSLGEQVNFLEGELKSVEQHTLALNSAVQTLHSQDIKSPQSYKQLAFNFFQSRPKISLGIGFGQNPNTLVKDTKWFYPYFYLDQKTEGQLGARLPSPNQEIFYSELFQDDHYFDRDYYTVPLKNQKVSWVEPYSSYGAMIATFAAPIFDDSDRIVAISNTDISLTKLTEEINKKKVFKDKGFFGLISTEGKIISYSPVKLSVPPEGEKGHSIDEVPQLKQVWSNLQKGKLGLVEAGGNVWAYQRMPSTGWLMIAEVPKSVIVAPVVFITIASTLGAATVLGVSIFLFMRHFRRSLKPILRECNRLARIDIGLQERMSQEDELGKLTISFFSLLEQLEAKEETIRQEVSQSIQVQEQLKQAENEQQERELIQTDIGHILEIVSAIEEGDLTVKADVSDRATGLVADTLNRLIEELARIMSVVLSTTQQVTQGAEQLEKLAVSTTEQVEQQAESVIEVQSLMENVNKLSQQTSQQALWSDEAVKEAQNAVTQGQQEMLSMTESIKILQQGTEQIVRRTQNLSDFVTLASQFTQDQKRVAALTRVLALNASTIATRASEQQDPEQFASVAREFATIATQVNDLAVQTNQSLVTLKQRTDQIQTVVSGIDEDIIEISGSVNQFTSNVDRSRQVFDNIKTVTAKVSQVGQEVTKSSVAIASVAETTLEAIQNIATAAAETERSSRDTLEQTGTMDRLARSLYSRVSFFQISEQIIEELPASRVMALSSNGNANFIEELPPSRIMTLLNNGTTDFVDELSASKIMSSKDDNPDLDEESEK
jgi:methyl-accepting chemotaxis protein